MKKQPQKSDKEIPISDSKTASEIGKRFSSAPARKLTKTTFQLTGEGYDFLQELAEKKASNVAAVLADLADVLSGEFLGPIVEACVKIPIQGKRIRRSYAVERRTLDVLQEVQKRGVVSEAKVSRDDLIEKAALVVRSFVKISEEDRLEKVKQSRDILTEFGPVMGEWFGKIEDILSDYPDHGIHARLNLLELVWCNLLGAMDDEIEKGIPVDPDGM